MTSKFCEHFYLYSKLKLKNKIINLEKKVLPSSLLFNETKLRQKKLNDAIDNTAVVINHY